MEVNLLLKDRMKIYIKENSDKLAKIAGIVYKDKTLFETTEANTLIYEEMDTIGLFREMLSKVFILIIVYIVLISLILNNSLVKSVTFNHSSLISIGH